MTVDLGRLTREFIMGESLDTPTMKSYIQSLEENLNSLNHRTIKEKNKIQIAKQHLKEVKRHVRRMEERLNILEEKVSVLEEKKEK